MDGSRVSAIVTSLRQTLLKQSALASYSGILILRGGLDLVSRTLDIAYGPHESSLDFSHTSSCPCQTAQPSDTSTCQSGTSQDLPTPRPEDVLCEDCQEPVLRDDSLITVCSCHCHAMSREELEAAIAEEYGAWWNIHTHTLSALLQRSHAGEDPAMIMLEAEVLANLSQPES